jgi:uncharacterized protein
MDSTTKNSNNLGTLGVFILAGLGLLGYFITHGLTGMKELDRTIAVKGLSEREVPADVAIWPIKFMEAENDLGLLYSAIQKKNGLIVDFLKKNGFDESEITVSSPSITDKRAQEWGGSGTPGFRYSGASAVSIYTTKVAKVLEVREKLLDLGKMGIAITGQDYDARTQFLFTKLNDVKPAMIEEATKNGREVAEKFAQDSQSSLGKIKRASQGQFTIEDRDANTPHVKKVRVVATIEYYLAD